MCPESGDAAAGGFGGAGGYGGFGGGAGFGNKSCYVSSSAFIQTMLLLTRCFRLAVVSAISPGSAPLVLLAVSVVVVVASVAPESAT